MRRGFTLVEVMCTTGIIVILASISWAVYASARQKAHEWGTAELIERIDSAVSIQMERVHTKRLTKPPAAVEPLQNEGCLTPVLKWSISAKRAMCQMALPDRWEDVISPALPDRISRTPFSSLCLDLYTQALEKTDLATVQKNESSELLYLICMRNKSAGMFRDTDSADTDGDGLREFVDDWGNPIRFIRWPAGFTTSVGGLSDPSKPDQWDVRQVTSDYATYPLIYSAGPDGLYDINPGKNADGSNFVYNIVDDVLEITPVDEQGLRIGEPLDSEGPHGEPLNGDLDYYDNVTNHRKVTL